jgi:hypothetical protein
VWGKRSMTVGQLILIFTIGMILAFWIGIAIGELLKRR